MCRNDGFYGACIFWLYLPGCVFKAEVWKEHDPVSDAGSYSVFPSVIIYFDDSWFFVWKWAVKEIYNNKQEVNFYEQVIAF